MVRSAASGSAAAGSAAADAVAACADCMGEAEGGQSGAGEQTGCSSGDVRVVRGARAVGAKV